MRKNWFCKFSGKKNFPGKDTEFEGGGRVWTEGSRVLTKKANLPPIKKASIYEKKPFSPGIRPILFDGRSAGHGPDPARWSLACRLRRKKGQAAQWPHLL